jgi:hypothetical protein
MKKLIAIGTENPNPKKWTEWDEVRLYIADSVEEAINMDGRYKNSPATEVDMTKSQFVLGMPDFPED